MTMWTYPPRRILVPVDFGDASAKALRLAGEIARQFDAEVSALHAETFEAPPYFTAEQIRAISKERRAARGEATRYLEAFAARVMETPVTPLISDAPPAQAIGHAARNFDLIVMGTHGRRGPARWWIGSVAERVVRETRIPVLVVRATAAAGSATFRRIAVIAGGGAFDGPARRYARGLASTFKAEAPRETAPSIRNAALQDASLAVVAVPPKGFTVFTAAEHALRNCRRPILFVPSI